MEKLPIYKPDEKPHHRDMAAKHAVMLVKQVQAELRADDATAAMADAPVLLAACTQAASNFLLREYLRLELDKLGSHVSQLDFTPLE